MLAARTAGVSGAFWEHLEAQRDLQVEENASAHVVTLAWHIGRMQVAQLSIILPRFRCVSASQGVHLFPRRCQEC
jgi:hypothetical protein